MNNNNVTNFNLNSNSLLKNMKDTPFIAYIKTRANITKKSCINLNNFI